MVIPSASISNCNGEEIVVRSKTSESFILSMYNRNEKTTMNTPTMDWIAIGY